MLVSTIACCQLPYSSHSRAIAAPSRSTAYGPVPAHGIPPAHGIQRLSGRFHQCFAGAGPDPAQDALHLREGLFDGREVRRVGWQEQNLRSRTLYELPDPLALVDLEVVHHHHLSVLERWCQEVLYVGLEGSRVGGARHAHRCHNAFGAQRGDERHVLAPVARSFSVGPLFSWGSRVKARQGYIRRAFVHEHKPPRIEGPHALAPSTSFLFVSLGGSQ